MALHTRLATPDDAAAICLIYNQGIEDRVATFETRPRSSEEVRAWFDGAHPIVVTEDAAGDVVAFAATSTYRPRQCYADIAEFSVYVARDARGRGAGRAAMLALIEAASQSGIRKLISRVFPENTASRALLRSLGFREVGAYRQHALLDGIWRDVVIIERLVPSAVYSKVKPLTTVLFACVHNAGRSQIAAAFFNSFADPAKARAISAGTEPSGRVHPEVVAAMREAGFDLSTATPQRLTPELAAHARVLVTMGCGDACPVVPGARVEDWPLDDPQGQSMERVRAIRDEIQEKVRALVAAEGWN